MKRPSFLQLFINCVKEVRQTKKDLKRLDNLELSMEALQRLVDTVSFGSNEVEIVVDTKDGRTITIKRAKNENGFESFTERYNREKQKRQ